MTAPVLQQTSPADDTTGVAVGSNLVLTYDQTVQAGAGVIQIRRVSDESLVKSIDITDASQISFSGNQVTVNPTTDLPGSTAFYVVMSGGAVRNLASENAASISSATAFNFTTAAGPAVDTTAPLLTGTTPTDNATGVAVGSNLVLTYNEAVQAGSGVIQIRRVSDEGLVKSIDITDASQVSFSGNQVTINPATDLPTSTAFYVVMTGGAVRDLASNNAASISSATTFNFTTAGGAPPDSIAPVLTGTTPNDNAISVAVGSNLVLTYNEAVQAGSGVLQIRRVSDESLVKLISIPDASQVSFSGNQVTINPTTDLPTGTAFYVVMTDGAVRDLAGNAAASISSATTFNFTTAGPGPADTTAPALTGTTPSDNATGVAVGSNLVLTYNEAVQVGSGVIQIRRVSDESLVKSIDITDASQVSFSGNQVTINPTTDLPASTAFYVVMTGGAVRDLAVNNAASISSATALNFTTAGGAPPDTTAPVRTGTTPTDNATNVAIGSNLVLTYNEVVQAGSGVIQIRKVSDESLVTSIDITDASQVSFSGGQVTVNPTSNLPEGTALYVVMTAGSVRDLAGNAAAGISTATAFNFTTLDVTAPTLQSTTPTDNAPDVDPASNFVFTFNEVVKAGTGSILIASSFNDSTFHSMAVTDTTQVTFSGNQLTINPNVDLIVGDSYYFVFDTGAVRDLANNSFAGLTPQTGYNFTVADTTPPALINAVTEGGGTVDDDPYFVLTFSEPVNLGSGNIEFRNALDGTLVRSFAIDDETQVYFGGSTIQITPDSPLTRGINYYVTIGGNVIFDDAGNPFAGISSPTAFKFSTLPVDLIGTQDDDELNGGNANELINGLIGIDTLTGGLGDDTYVIDNYEGGQTSFRLYAPPGLFGDFHKSWSFLPTADEVDIELADIDLDGVVDHLAFGFQHDDDLFDGIPYDFAYLIVSTYEAGENLAEGETYTGVRPVGNSDHVGLTLHSSFGWETTDNYASFTITELDIDYSDPDDPVLLSLSINFESRNYQPDFPVMYGTVNYNYAAAGEAMLDTIVEASDAGTDTVRAAIDYTLGDNLENLELTEGAKAGTGNALNNIITGNGADNVLDGKAGVDTMYGSYGDDTYIVDNTADKAIEDQDSFGGVDEVKSSATFTLGLYIEKLTLTGTPKINGTGNASDNTITGSAANNILSGAGGSDLLLGGGGNDTFWVVSGDGNDTIGDFSAGPFVGDMVALDGFAFLTFSAVKAAMSQQSGNTVLNLGNGETLTFLNVLPVDFFVNDFAFVTPHVSPLPFTLPLTGAFTNTVTGTNRANSLSGTAANDKLDGNGGTDTMSGLAGDDTYIVDDASDAVVEATSSGIDTVISTSTSYLMANNVENLILMATGSANRAGQGNDLDNLIIASTRNDHLGGGGGNDILRPGTGACVLTGDTGNDIFDFDVMGSQKQIMDFTLGQDLLDLRTLLTWYGGSDPIADNVISISAATDGVLVSVKGSAGGSLQGLVNITHVWLGSLEIGGDILWDS